MGCSTCVHWASQAGSHYAACYLALDYLLLNELQTMCKRPPCMHPAAQAARHVMGCSKAAVPADDLAVQECNIHAMSKICLKQGACTASALSVCAASPYWQKVSQYQTRNNEELNLGQVCTSV